MKGCDEFSSEYLKGLTKFKKDFQHVRASSRSDCVSLKRLGKVLHLSKSRSLIVKLSAEPSMNIGSKVLDSKLKEVGIVQDIFGPVSCPYVSIKPVLHDPSSAVGKIVYILG